MRPMSDTAHIANDNGTLRRFPPPEQADAHVRRWRLEQWFWERFETDRLDSEALPPEWLQ